MERPALQKRLQAAAMILFLAGLVQAEACPECANTQEIPRSIHEAARDKARANLD